MLINLFPVLLFLELDVQVGIVQKHHQNIIHDDVIFIVHLAARPLDGFAGLGILKHLEHEVDLIKAAPGVCIGKKDDGRQGGGQLPARRSRSDPSF